MDRRHTVDEAVFDISFDSAATALRQKSELAAFVQERLLALTDEIFNEISADGTVLRIDRLEIDLGDVDYRTFKDEMTSRFKENLRARLLEKRAELAAAPSPTEYAKSAVQVERDSLKSFLETGQVTGHAGTRITEDLERKLLQLVRSDDKAFAEFLKTSACRDVVVKRLARQFPDHVLVEIARHLAAAFGSAREFKFDETTAFFAGDGVKQPTSPQQWERLINDLLDGAMQRDPEHGATTSTPEPRVLSSDTGPVDGSSYGTSKGAVLTPVSEPVARAGHGDDAPERRLLLSARLESAFMGGNSGEIGDVWDELCGSHAELVREVFMRRAGGGSTRERLARGFTEAMLYGLVKVLEPWPEGFIKALLEQPECFPEHGESRIRQALWVQTLAYLHAAGTQRLEREDYIRAVIGHWSRSGVAQAAMRRALRRVDPACADAMFPPEGLSHEAEARSRTISAQARGEDLYERLVRRLSGAVGDDAALVLDQLSGTHPELLGRLYGQLRGGEVACDVDVLSEAELRCLVNSMTSRNELNASVQPSQHDIHAGHAQGDKSYYRNILLRLMNDNTHRRAAASEARREDAGRQEHGGRAEKKEKANDPGDGFLDELESALTQGRAAGIAAAWSGICSQHASRMREIFARCMGNEEARKNLAAGFPEAMLFDLVNLLVPSESRFVEQVAVQPELRLSGNGGEQGKNTLVWEYTLGHIHAVGSSRFVRRDYVQGLVRYLTEHGVSRHTLERMLRGLGETGSVTADGEQRDNPGFASETRRGNATYQRIVRRLSGTSQEPDTAEVVGELARTRPALLLDLYRRLQAGELPIDLNCLNANETKQLVIGFLGLCSEGSTGDFLRAIEQHARRARDERHYYRSILASLIHNRIVDLEKAAGETHESHDTQPSQRSSEHRTAGLDTLLPSPGQEWRGKGEAIQSEFLRVRLETAFLNGHAGTINDVWDELRFNHADLIKDAFVRWMGDARSRARLAQGFPERMLSDLVSLLVPSERRFVAEVAAQPELRLSGKGTQERKNILLWDYTLGHIHAVGGGRFVRQDYVQGLVRYLTEHGVARHTLERVARGLRETEPAAYSVQREIAALAPETRPSNATYQRIVSRLSGTSHEPDTAEAVGELVRSRPDLLLDLYRRLQTGELPIDLNCLNANETKQLVVGFLGLGGGEGGTDAFLGAIEQHAKRAGDERHYYRYILASLIHNRIVDLEKAVGETRGRDDTQPAPSPSEKRTAVQDNTPPSRRVEQHSKAHAGVTAHTLEPVAPLLQEPGLATVTMEQTETPSRGPETRRISALYHRIERRLSGRSEELETAAAVGELARTRPELLLDLYRRLRAGELPIAVGRITAQEAKQFVIGFLSLGNEGATDDFLRAIEQHAKGARDQRRYYQAILDSLVHNRIVDLEQAAAEGWQEAVGGQDAPGGVSAKRARLSPTAERAGDAGTGAEKIDSLQDDRHLLPPAAPTAAHSARSSSGARQHEKTGVIPEPEGNPRAAIAGEKRAYLLYRQLVHRLRGTGQEIPIAREIEELVAIAPQRIDDLYGQLTSGALTANMARITAEEARNLALAFVSLNRSGEASGPHRMIEAQAAKVRDIGRYYRHILENLMRNEAVDLEAAARSGSMPADGNERQRAPSGPVPAMKHANDPAAQQTVLFDDGQRNNEAEWAEEIYIANAGLVLAAPYLPRLFHMLELTSGSRFKDEQAAERAVHLLQATVNGSWDSPEFLLVLNKILCGVLPGIPIAKGIEPLAREKEAVEGMLAAIIKNWKIIGNTSVQGLREAFLQRAGRLRRKGDDWYLQVEKKGIDVLLDQLPWSFSVIKYAWMPRPVYVEWR